jgi:hypothetical protein
MVRKLYTLDISQLAMESLTEITRFPKILSTSSFRLPHIFQFISALLSPHVWLDMLERIATLFAYSITDVRILIISGLPENLTPSLALWSDKQSNVGIYRLVDIKAEVFSMFVS